MYCFGLQVSKTLGVFDSLLSLHTQVSSSSQTMSSNTEALLAQKATLTEFAEALRARLKFFDEYELAANQFASAAASPDSADLMPLLHKLDECISYVAANPQYADAVTYANKFRQLQLKALGLVRGRVQSVLRSAAQTVQAAAAEAAAGGAAAGAPAPTAGAPAAGRLSGRTNSGALAGGRVAVLPEGLEVSLLYVRFRAAAEPALKGGRSQHSVQCGQRALSWPAVVRLVVVCFLGPSAVGSAHYTALLGCLMRPVHAHCYVHTYQIVLVLCL
jgi:hypothetical protein